MSEHRKPTHSFTVRFAEKRGKKTANNMHKIEVFPAHYFASKWEPGSKLFCPKLPLNSVKRVEAWERLYRVKIDGLWVVGNCKYTLFSRDEIIEKWLWKKEVNGITRDKL